MAFARYIPAAAALAGWLLIANQALADSVRCGTRLVRDGATTKEVVDKCGRPDKIETSDKPVYRRLANGQIIRVGHEAAYYWHYDFGPRKFPVRMTIVDGVAEEIEKLTRR